MVINLELWIFCLSCAAAMCVFIKLPVFRISTLTMIMVCISILIGHYFNEAYAFTFFIIFLYVLIRYPSFYQ